MQLFRDEFDEIVPWRVALAAMLAVAAVALVAFLALRGDGGKEVAEEPTTVTAEAGPAEQAEINPEEEEGEADVAPARNEGLEAWCRTANC